MSNNYLHNKDLQKDLNKTIISINQCLNEKSELVEVVILLDDGHEIYISGENNESLVVYENQLKC